LHGGVQSKATCIAVLRCLCTPERLAMPQGVTDVAAMVITCNNLALWWPSRFEHGTIKNIDILQCSTLPGLLTYPAHDLVNTHGHEPEMPCALGSTNSKDPFV
jgi:hypothetical protein